MLSFTVYFLLKNPDALRKLREEIDTRIGDRPMTVQDVNKLPYLLGASFHISAAQLPLINDAVQR